MDEQLLEIYRSKEHDPYLNLAAEEYLCEYCGSSNKIVLYLWQNQNTVVIGRNQNAYEQCNMDYIKKHEIKIARRLSGGGAVYHDLGNLNYTIVCSSGQFSKEKYTKMIIESIRGLGVYAEASGRNDITAGGFKISGTAYFSNGHASYQHGCILVNTDQEAMYRALRIKEDKIISKNIKSVYSRTANLQDICRNIDIEKLSAQLMDTFHREYKHARMGNMRLIYESGRFQRLAEKYKSRDWNLGKDSDSRIDVYGRLGFGSCSIVFHTEEGIIKNTKLYTDSLLIEPVLQAEKILADIPCTKDCIIEQLKKHRLDICICDELIKLFQEKMENG